MSVSSDGGPPNQTLTWLLLVGTSIYKLNIILVSLYSIWMYLPYPSPIRVLQWFARITLTGFSHDLIKPVALFSLLVFIVPQFIHNLLQSCLMCTKLPLWTTTFIMTVWNKNHSDSVFPASLRMWSNLCLRQKTIRTGTSVRRSLLFPAIWHTSLSGLYQVSGTYGII